MDKKVEMNPNLLVRFPGKPASESTCDDIIRYCRENAVQFINLHYCGWAAKCNPPEQAQDKDFSYKQTFEWRVLGQYCGLPY